MARKKAADNAQNKGINEEFFLAVKLMAAEKGLDEDILFDKIANALVVAERRKYNGKDVIICDIDKEALKLNVYLRKNVVEEISDEDTDILVEAAQAYKKDAMPGDIIEIELDTKNFGRIDAQTAKHVIRQGIREAERGKTLEKFKTHNQSVTAAKVTNVDPRTGNATVIIDNSEALLPKNEQIPGEEYKDGEVISVYMVDVKETERGPKAMLSRTHSGLVRHLFQNEVPEIAQGTVEIKEIAREAGSRTKMAVVSTDENVDAVGACIGARSARVNKVLDILNRFRVDLPEDEKRKLGEKVDIVDYYEDPAAFVAEALKPATVNEVIILSEEEKSCKVIVPDDQLSLAIGNKGQNARLAAKLTGWKIDINPESGLTEDAKDQSSEEEAE